MGWWKYLCKYISVCAPLSCSSAGSGVDNVPFPQSREHSLLTEISAAMAWGMFGVDSAAPGELMRGQVVAGAHCSRSYLHLGGLGKTLLLPHLHICWVLSTGSCSMQRAHRSVHGCPGLKAFQPFLVSWWQGWACTAEQELGFPGAEERWFHAVPMTCKHGWRPGEDNLSATGLPHSGPLYAQVCFELDALPFSDGWGWALKLCMFLFPVFAQCRGCK